MKLLLRACLVITIASSIVASAGAQQSTDYDINPTWLEGLEYRNIGPWRGGRVTAVAGVVGDDQTYYMGATGGVFKTTNAGVSWEPVDNDHVFGTASVGAIDVSVSDPNVVVVGMGESPFRGVASSHGDGVYKSTDAGKSWTHLGLEETRQISSVKIHPANPDIIWVAAQGSPWAPTESRGVYKSTDGGATWNKVLFISETTGAVDLKYDATNPRILYAAMWDWQRRPWEIRSGGEGSGIWKSNDGGDTWKELTTGLPELMGKIGVAPSPAKSGRVWAVVEAEKKGGVYRSEDGGKTWSHVNGDRRIQARSWYYMHIFADPNDENTVYVQNAPFMKSVDGGKSFTRIVGRHGDHHDLWINPKNSKNMIDGNDGGAEITFDGGETWSELHNQPTAQFYRVSVDNQFFYQLYGGQQDNSAISVASYGPDGAIGREDYYSIGGCESAHAAFDPDNPRYIYAGCYLGLISEYDHETQTSRDVRAYTELEFGVPPQERKYRFNWNAPIVVSAHNPQVIYHAGNVLLKSTDRGVTWNEISPDLTRDEEEKQGKMGGPITNEVSENYNTIFYVAESPHEAGTIWVGTDDGLVHITRDEGQSWNDVTPRGLDESLINMIEVSPHDPARAYVVATGYKYNDHTPRIYVTDNYGRSWDQIAGGIPEGHFVRVVREDPEREGLLFAGTEMGLFVSFDGGQDWQPLQLNLPVVPVTDLRVHRGDLVVATQGRSFWILDDISPLRQISSDIVDAEAHLFSPSPALYLSTEGNSNAGRGENPPTRAVLYYALGNELDLNETTLKIEILNSSGRVIRTLESNPEKGQEGGGSGSSFALPAKQGLNRAIWDLRLDPATEVPGLFAFAGGGDNKVDGYIVGPGDYRARLTVETTTVEQPLTVRWDPRLELLTEEAIAEQQDLVAQSYQMVDILHRSINSFRKVREQAEMRKNIASETGGQDALVDAAEAVITATKEWENSVTNPEREFFQDVLNWPDKIDSRAQGILGTLDGILGPVTQGMKQRFEDVRREWNEAIERRDSIVAEEIAAYNDAFTSAGVDPLAVPPFEPNHAEQE